MISSDLENLPPSTPALQIHHFKPLFPRFRQVVEPLPCNFRKNHDKYIHSLSLKPNKKNFLKRNKMPKTLRLLNIDSWQPGENLALLKKLVKPYIKFIKNAQGSLKHPQIQRLLPLLTTLEVNINQESFRVLSLHSGFTKLQFRIFPNYIKNQDKDAIIQRNKPPLSRNLARMKDLKRISMVIKAQETKSTILVLEILDQNIHLDSQDHLSLNIVPGFSSTSPPQFPADKARISKIVKKITHLSTEFPTWLSFLISSGKLASLTSLNVKFDSKEYSWDSREILQFHNFPVLKKLTLNLIAHHSRAETDFFENFALSSSIEDLNFTFTDFSLSLTNQNDASSSPFFKRLQEEAKGVKALTIRIIENISNSTLIAKFACLFIKCFDSLETLNCSRLQGCPVFLRYITQRKPLDFQEFWTAITPSKETLQSISVHITEIVFPRGMKTPLETEFPRLQKLELSSKISSAAELGRICQKISSLKEVTLNELKLRNEEELKVFLHGIKDIQQGAKFEVYLDVGGIKQKSLIDCLKNYIEDVQVKGQLGVEFKNVRVEDEKAYEEILELVVKKGCFERFLMATTVPLFSVEENNCS